MQTVLAPRGDARTLLTYFVGGGIDEDRYAVQRFAPWLMATSFPSTRTGPSRRAGGESTPDDRLAEDGREDAARARRNHHRDGDQTARLGGPALGLAGHGDFRGSQAEGLTGVLLRTPCRPAAGSHSRQSATKVRPSQFAPPLLPIPLSGYQRCSAQLQETER